MKYIIAIAVVALILSIPGINIYHHITVPEINPHRVTNSHFCNFRFPYVHKQVDVRLEDTIHSDTLWYDDVIQALQESNYGDEVIFHLAGYGGDAETMFDLINNVRSCKARTVMIVEAPVYSAHSDLAVSGNELIMRPYSFMMFHESSAANTDCTKQTGEDRGVSNVEHCNIWKSTIQYFDVMLVTNNRYLKPDEKTAILLGHDVYITSLEYGNRTGQIIQ